MKEPDVTDQVGKVFLVLRGARMCVVCDRVFTREEAAKHAGTACKPSAEIPQGKDK